MFRIYKINYNKKFFDKIYVLHQIHSNIKEIIKKYKEEIKEIINLNPNVYAGLVLEKQHIGIQLITIHITKNIEKNFRFIYYDFIISKNVSIKKIAKHPIPTLIFYK